MTDRRAQKRIATKGRVRMEYRLYLPDRGYYTPWIFYDWVTPERAQHLTTFTDRRYEYRIAANPRF